MIFKVIERKNKDDINYLDVDIDLITIHSIIKLLHVIGSIGKI